ncbi:MAG: translocation/assembly module TamB [Candidatus Cloacimonetes bacterium]|nr:translocation/assembly module TamB [Candidatus Cloacimonadota bacterium]
MMKKLKKLLLILLLLLVIFFFLLFLFAVFTQTAPFRSLLTKIIINQSEKYLAGELSIGSLEGNFYNHIIVRDIEIIDQGEQVFYLSELSLYYQLRPLLKKQVIVTKVLLNDLDIIIAEEEYGWNWQRILKLAPFQEIAEQETKPEKEGQELGWEIDVENISLTNFDIVIRTLNEEEQFIPSSINDFNLESTFSMKADLLKFDLQKTALQINWQNGFSLNINNISFFADMSDDEISLADFILDTDNFLLTASSKTKIDLTKLTAELELTLHNSSDFTRLFPNLKQDTDLRLIVDLRGEAEKLDLSLALQDDMGRLDLTLAMINPPYLDSEMVPEYTANISVVDFNPAAWLIDDSFYSLLNGNIILSGNGFDYLTGFFTVSIDLYNSVFHAQDIIREPILIKVFSLDTELNNKVLQTDLHLLTEDFGLLGLIAHMGDIEHLSDFQLTGRIESLDLAFISALEDLPSNLNITFAVSGKNPEERPIEFQLEVTASEFAGFPIEKVELKASLIEKGVQIDTLFCNIVENVLQVSGFISETEESKADFILSINNISPILSWIDEELITNDLEEERDPSLPLAEMIETQGVLSGSVTGILGELSVNGILNLKDSRYGNIFSEEIYNEFTITQEEDLFLAQIELFLRNVLINEIHLETLTLNGQLDREKVNIGLIVNQSPDIALTLNADIYQNDEIEIVLHRLDLNLLEDFWYLSEDNAFIGIKGDTFDFTDFTLKNQEQVFKIDGLLSLSESNNFRLVIEEFNLSPLLELFEVLPVSSGILTIDLSLLGTMIKPELNSDIYLTEIRIHDLPDLSTIASMQYISSTETLQADLNLLLQEVPYADIVLYLPIKLSLEDGLKLHEDRNFYVNLRTSDIALTTFDGMIADIRGLNGILEAELTIGNFINDIRAIGSVEISNAGFSLPVINTRYRNFNLLLELDNNRFDLKQFNLNANQGRLSSDGYIILGKDLAGASNGLMDEELTVFNLQLRTDNFQLINTAALDLLIDSRLTIEGSPDHPLFSGRIDINRGRIDIDRLVGDMLTDSKEKPLLLQTRERQTISEDEIVTKSPADKFEMQNLRGEIAVSFPRNTWIRSSDMNIEMSGDLNIVVDGPHIEIFGNLSTLRGYYVFFGKRFNIEMGEIVFSGGRELDPSLALQAIYSFRGLDSTRNSLRLIVTGSLEDMQIAFELNDQPIEEADAISYILFGRSFDELTQGEKTEAQNQALVVGGFLANRLTDQLSTVIGESFQLDVLEFRSDTTRSEIGLEIGKYITDNLFVSYKRDFSFDKTQDQVFEEILVEYAITRFLYLQASRRETNDFGVDIIWRFRWR